MVTDSKYSGSTDLPAMSYSPIKLKPDKRVVFEKYHIHFVSYRLLQSHLVDPFALVG